MTVSPLRLLAVVGLAGALTACNSISNVRLPSFLGGGDREPAAQAARGQRIPVLSTDLRLTPAEALRGTGFQIGEAQAVTEWPLPGYNTEQVAPHVQGVTQFQIAWRRDIGAGTGGGSRLMAPPVSSGGRIFVMDGEARVSAYDAASGERAWSVDLRRRGDSGWGGGLAVADGRLYVTSGHRFAAALDPASGSEVWRRDLETPVHGAPNAANGRVYFVDLNNTLRALDGATGNEVWNHQALIESARIAKASSPAISGDAVIAAFSSGELGAFRAVNGSELWSETLSLASRTSALSEIRDIPGRPVVHEGSVYAVSHSGVFSAVDARTGQSRWNVPLVGISTPIVSGDVVYVVDNTGQLAAVSRQTGQVFWVRDLSEGRTRRTSGTLGLRLFGRRTIRPTWSGPLLASGRLILVSTFGEAVAVDATTGVVQGSLELGASAHIAPIAVNGTAYVVTEAGQLVAIR